MSQEVDLDVALVLAAAVKAVGGSLEIPYAVLSDIDPETVALAIDPNADETGIVLALVDASEVVYE